MADLPPNSVQPEDQAAWRAGLEAHHARDDGVWLVLRKKAGSAARLTYDEVVEEALCFGWVDSKPRRLDEQRSMLYVAPRRAGSGWSRLNKARVERLIQQGRLAPAGLAKVEAARHDGSWAALDAIEALEIPEDLASALANHPPATTRFERFPRSAKRQILEWIASARTPETRGKRVQETAQLAQLGERANQWQRKGQP